jgi:hypothetical protein
MVALIGNPPGTTEKNYMSWLSALFAPPTPPPAINVAAQQQELTEIDTGDFRGFIVGEIPIVLSKERKGSSRAPKHHFLGAQSSTHQ